MTHCVSNHTGYNAKRNFFDLPFDDVSIERRIDPFKVLDHTYYRMRGESNLFLHNLWFDFGQYPLVHLWNGISLGRSPWLTSFEDYLPRWSVNSNRFVSYGLKQIADDRCKILIALSKAARDRQIYFTEQFEPDLLASIADKIHVLLPPQEVLISSYDDKSLSNDVTDFVLVGHDFFRKGGREVVRAFDQLLREGAPVRLTVVSMLQYGDYASRSTREDVEEMHSLLSRHQGHITYHERLPYAEVQDLFKRTHVGLLPTWSDTFGYSVLEAQAAGCPVITTDVNALPEVNNSSTGWVIRVPRHSWKAHADIGTEESRRKLSECIEHGVYAAVGEILSDPGSVRRKGELSLQRIRDDHDPRKAAAFLERIYHKALA